MKIKALKTFEGGFTHESFAFGGTKKPEDIRDIKYPYNIISYLIDTGVVGHAIVLVYDVQEERYYMIRGDVADAVVKAG